jgi:hypothetical protein
MKSQLDIKIESKCCVLTEDKLDKILRIPQTPCIGNWNFKIISTNCHKTPETETI